MKNKTLKDLDNARVLALNKKSFSVDINMAFLFLHILILI